MSQKRFIIIDGNALLHRAWHALPPLTTKSGLVVNAVYGFIMILLKVLKELKPQYLAIAFDTRAPTFRDKIYEPYKAKRIKQPQELYDQIPLLKKLISAFNIAIFEKEGYEADDIIGTLAQAKDKIENIIVTGDLDTLQLIDDQTKVYTLKRGITETMIYDFKAVKERYQLNPSQMIDFKALRGDPSDNIPGIKGIGEKTAIELLKEFGSLEEIYKTLPTKEGLKIKEKIKTKLQEHQNDLSLSKKLVTIIKDVPLDFDFEKCRWGEFDRGGVVKLFQELEFYSLLNKIPLTEKQSPLKQSSLGDKEEKKQWLNKDREFTLSQNFRAGCTCHLIDNEEKFDNFLKELKKQKSLALDTETTDLNPRQAKLLGMSVSWDSRKAYYVEISDFRFQISDFKNRVRQEWLSCLKPILENPQIAKTGHNIKYDLEILENEGIELKGIDFDTMIASYLLNPGSRQHNLSSLVFTVLGKEMILIENLIGKGQKQIKMNEVPLSLLSQYSCEDAYYTWQLRQKFTKELKEKNLAGLFYKIEMPLIPILAQMESNGIKIDSHLFKKLSQEVEKKIYLLTQKIYQLAGVVFNINSPQQLKEILFSRLRLSAAGLGKTKTGISTAASELEKLKGKHPIINLISEHRELSKLKSTYLDTLPQLIDRKTKRIHTNFNQTVTATGRLSSSDPNLQNIPIRGELGQKIRKGFIAEKGYQLLSLDYSQIELRIIASLANDASMIKAFQKKEDIHLRTAANIYDRPIEKVSSLMRRQAKAINFGIIYGMGPGSLAESAGISKDQAKVFIDKYFILHSGIKEYIIETKALALSLGYVETLFGRRRYLPEIHSNVQVLRAAAERIAINMPIQGTAADLIKLAMIEIDSSIRAKGWKDKVKMVLQVHDELVFEVKSDLVSKAARVIKEIMENIYKLRVPIEVIAEAGDSWGEMYRV